MEEISLENKPLIEYQRYRVFPLIVEFVPILIVIIGLVIKSEDIIMYGFCSLSIVYLLLSWWIFKSEKFKIFEIIFALGLGAILFSGTMGLLFLLMSWEYSGEMSWMSLSLCIPAFLFTVLYYFLNNEKQFQFTYSLKAMSRLGIMGLILFIFLNAKYL